MKALIVIGLLASLLLAVLPIFLPFTQWQPLSPLSPPCTPLPYRPTPQLYHVPSNAPLTPTPTPTPVPESAPREWRVIDRPMRRIR